MFECTFPESKFSFLTFFTLLLLKHWFCLPVSTGTFIATNTHFQQVSFISLQFFVYQLNNYLYPMESNNQLIIWLHIRSVELRPVSCWSYLETSCCERRVTSVGSGQVRGGSVVSCADVFKVIVVIAAACDVRHGCCLFISSLAAAVRAVASGARRFDSLQVRTVNYYYYFFFRCHQLSSSLSYHHPRSLRQLFFLDVFSYFWTLIKTLRPPLSVPPSTLVFLCFCFVFFATGRCLQITTAPSKRVSAALSRATHSLTHPSLMCVSSPVSTAGGGSCRLDRPPRSKLWNAPCAHHY